MIKAANRTKTISSKLPNGKIHILWITYCLFLFYCEPLTTNNELSAPQIIEANLYTYEQFKSKDIVHFVSLNKVDTMGYFFCANYKGKDSMFVLEIKVNGQSLPIFRIIRNEGVNHDILIYSYFPKNLITNDDIQFSIKTKNGNNAGVISNRSDTLDFKCSNSKDTISLQDTIIFSCSSNYQKLIAHVNNWSVDLWNMDGNGMGYKSTLYLEQVLQPDQNLSVQVKNICIDTSKSNLYSYKLMITVSGLTGATNSLNMQPNIIGSDSIYIANSIKETSVGKVWIVKEMIDKMEDNGIFLYLEQHGFKLW